MNRLAVSIIPSKYASWVSPKKINKQPKTSGMKSNPKGTGFMKKANPKTKSQKLFFETLLSLSFRNFICDLLTLFVVLFERFCALYGDFLLVLFVLLLACYENEAGVQE